MDRKRLCDINTCISIHSIHFRTHYRTSVTVTYLAKWNSKALIAAKGESTKSCLGILNFVIIIHSGHRSVSMEAHVCQMKKNN